MKNFLIFIFSILFFTNGLFGMENTDDLLKLLNKSEDVTLNKYYPSALINNKKYNVYFKTRSFSQIVDVNNYSYNEGASVNFQINNFLVGVGADLEQFKIGNYTLNEYTGVVGSRLLNSLNLGLSFNFKTYGYTTEYSEPLLTDNNKLYFDVGFSGSADVYKGIIVGLSGYNILNSESVDGGIVDSLRLTAGMGYNLKNYGVIGAGFSRVDGYNNFLLSYGIKYNILYAQLDYDFLSVKGSLMLESEIFNKIEMRFIGSIMYIMELGMTYNVGISFGL